MVTASTRLLFVRVATRLAPVLPRRLGYALAGWTGDVLSVAARTMRSNYDANVVQAMGGVPEQLPRLRRAAFRNLAWNYLELFTLASTSRQTLRDCGSVAGLAPALTAAAHEASTGAVITFGHVGNIELLSHVGEFMPDQRFAVVVERMRDERLGRLLTHLRRHHGLELIPADEPRLILRALRSGVHVVVACDYDSTHSGIVADLLGRPARLPAGAVRLALGTGAPLFMVMTARDRPEDPSHFDAYVVGPLRLVRTGDRRADVRAGVALVTSLHTGHVQRHPDQWLAFREIWEAA